MVLYHAISTYQLLNLIVFKLKYKNDENSVLLISSWLVEKFPNYMRLNSIFDRVIVYDPFVNPKNEEYPTEIDDYLTSLFKKEKLILKDFDEIHIGGVHFGFGFYCEHHNIPFVFWEDASGIVSKSYILQGIESKFNINKAKYCEKHGLYSGKCTSVNMIFCNFSAQTIDFDKSNCNNFDVVEELMNMEESMQQIVVSLFTDINKIDIENNSVLVLTQHFTNLKIMTFEEQILIYQLFVDYFFPNENIVFKPHPDDVMYYSQLFGNSKVIREKFPSEFLPIMFSTKPKMIATISSTAINNVKNHFDSYIALDIQFEKDFTQIHKYYVLSDIKNRFCSNYCVDSIGANEKVISYFVKTDDKDNKFTFVDDINQYDTTNIDIIKKLKNLNDKDVVAFVNSKNDYSFYDLFAKEVFDYIVPIKISKKQIRENDFYASVEDDIVYLFTKDKELRSKIESYSTKYKLHSTGLEISVPESTIKDRQLLILDCIKNASEYQILKRMSQVSEVAKVKTNNKIIYEITFSDKKIPIHKLNEIDNQIRVMEGIIKSNEERLLYYMRGK